MPKGIPGSGPTAGKAKKWGFSKTPGKKAKPATTMQQIQKLIDKMVEQEMRKRFAKLLK